MSTAVAEELATAPITTPTDTAPPSGLLDMPVEADPTTATAALEDRGDKKVDMKLSITQLDYSTTEVLVNSVAHGRAVMAWSGRAGGIWLPAAGEMKEEFLPLGIVATITMSEATDGERSSLRKMPVVPIWHAFEAKFERPEEKAEVDTVGVDISSEEYRVYEWPVAVDASGKSIMRTLRIDNPSRLFIGGTTHRVLDFAGNVYCVPSVGVQGCSLQWRPKAGEPAVKM